MSKAASPNFVLFVRSVEGHLVSRPDGGGRSYFGARVASFEERAAGEPTIKWDTAQVIPLTDVFVATYPREIAEWFRSGGLEKVDAEAFDAWVKFEAKRDAESHPEPTDHEQPAQEPTAEESK